MMDDATTLQERNLARDVLIDLVQDYHDFNPAHIQFVDRIPSAVEFSKQVSRGLPSVYDAGAVLVDCGAYNWDARSLIEAVDQDVEVAVTPDGRADAICALKDSPTKEPVFLQPANINMSMKCLLATLDKSMGNASSDSGSDSRPVHYLQSQNSNLTSTPLSPLLQDLPSNLSFAQEVLGEPEAVNIWIGDDRSVTSVHRDPYENLYIVIRGSKVFTLWPPVDEVCMHTQMLQTGRYVYDAETSAFDIVLDENDSETNEPARIPWIPVDPAVSRECLNTVYPLYKYARPQTVVVKAGQMLYLPSGWFHHVAQRCGQWPDGSRAPCIAVNYWYDMDYEGEKHVMRQLQGRLVQIIRDAGPVKS